MKPSPQGKLMYYYFYQGSDLREIIRFLREIECFEFECNKFVLVLVQIDLLTTVSRSITFFFDQTVINLGSELITQNRS